jgi:tetratricopeptide (TPR) repeat protein
LALAALAASSSLPLFQPASAQDSKADRQEGSAGELSVEQQREKLTAERFLQVLLRRPTPGTALDRVFGYHIGRGDIGELLDDLTETAQSGNDEEAGRHWMVVGLLQSQRGEDAAAITALRKARELLPENATAAYQLGRSLLLVGETEQAIDAMQDAIELQPPKRDYLNIASQLGRLYQRIGQREKAMETWQQLEQAFPGDDRVRQQIARAMLEEGDIEGAFERFSTLAKEARSPNDQIVFALRATDLQIRLGNRDEGIQAYERLLSRLRPGSYLHGEARRRIEATFLESADYAGLADYYEKWVGNHPDDVDAVIRLARFLSIQGRDNEAIEWFEKAIERSPTASAPRLALIDALIASQQFAKADKQYESLIEIEPNNPDHYVRWGQVLIEDRQRSEQERKSAAADVWTRLAGQRADDPVIQSQVADLLRGAELTEAAIERYRTAIKLAPTDPQYKEYLGEYLHRLGRKDEALQVWRSLAAGDLRTRNNLVRLAEVFNQFDLPDQALQTMDAACQLDPTLEERLRYAEWLREAEQFDRSLQQLSLAEELAESSDDRERLFESEVKTYQAGGRLAERIDEAEQASEANPEDGNRWRQLAILYQADRQFAEALNAIEKALQFSPDSIEALMVASRMYEEIGRLGPAIELRHKLAERDRRFRSGHLQKLSSLYLQSGQTEKAVEAGKELLAAAAGSVESHRFYANLCGRIGRADERLDTLRRCVRMNPRSDDAQRMLAEQLAEDFKTDQAIELYWTMLDNADEIEDKRAVVKTLADLYLRSNRLDQLLARLEIRGRESADRRTTIDLLATAHQQAGDLGLARQTLESLLQDRGRDTMLLERLVLLAEQAGEYDEAIELQRQLQRLAPNRKNESRLASLLIDIGAVDEARAIWLGMSASETDKGQLLRNLDRLFAAGETATAIKLAEQMIDRDPSDWETLVRLMVLQGVEGDWEASKQSADRLLALNVSDDTQPPTSPGVSRSANASGNTAQIQAINQLPKPIRQMQRMYELVRLTDSRYSSQQAFSLPKPTDFGHAKSIAKFCQLKAKQQQGDSLDDYLKTIRVTATAENASAADARNWFMTTLFASMIRQQSFPDYRNPDNWEPLWRLAEADPETGDAMISMTLRTRVQIAGRSNTAIEPLSEDRLEWLEERAVSGQPLAPGLAGFFGGSFSWSQAYVSEMKIAGKDEEAKAFTTRRLKEALNHPDPDGLEGLLQQASIAGNDDQLWSVIEKIDTNDPALQLSTVPLPSLRLLTLFTSPDRQQNDLSKGAADPEYRGRVVQLINRTIDEAAKQPLRKKTIRLTGVGGPRSTYRIVGGNYQSISIEFPPKGLGPDDTFVKVIHNAWEQFKGHTDELGDAIAGATDADQSSAEASSGPRPRVEILRRLTLASLHFWDQQIRRAIEQLDHAGQIAAESVPQMEAELKLMQADLLLRQNRRREALDLIDALPVYDQQSMAVREFAAARLSAAMGNRQRAQTAARRLFGVRLNTEAQIELAKLMRKLGMTELSGELVRRMRSRSGNSTEQLSALMTYFAAEGEQEQAAEVAMELLRRSQPSRRTSQTVRTSDQARRRNALQTLASAGRLNSLIKATEKRLENAPKSQRIRFELAEMYAASGQQNKSAELIGGSNLEDVRSTAALESTAKQLVASGKMDEACEAYLKLLRRDQSNFSQQFYDIKRPFDEKQRLGDLAQLMIDVGLDKFDSFRVTEICDDMLRNESETESARKLYLAMLESDSSSQQNAAFSLSNVLDSAERLLINQAMVEKTTEYLIKASQRGSPNRSLFQGYSTGPQGRHNNAATYLVRFLARDDTDESFRKVFENRLREELEKDEQWHEGSIWLGLYLAARKRYDEAKQRLQPLVNDETKPNPTHDMAWLTGSLIDEHKPMQDFAEQLYEYALENLSDNSNREFKYSLRGRVCNFMADIGKNGRARELAIAAIKDREKNPPRSSSNAQYEAYREITWTIGMIEFLAKIEAPADGLRLAREFDRSLFAKAGSYQRNRDQELARLEASLLKQLQEQGGLATLRSLMDPKTESSSAIEFSFSMGQRPFTETGISSLWVNLVEDLPNDPDDAEKLQGLVEELKQLREQRPDDLSVRAAMAIAADVAGDREPLRKWLSQMAETVNEKDNSRPSTSAKELQTVTVGLLRLDRASADGDQGKQDRELAARFPFHADDPVSKVLAAHFYAQLGKQAQQRGETERAEAAWRQAVTRKPNQLLLLDLALASVELEMPELSAAAFAASIESPQGLPAEPQPEKNASAGSLGQLLSGVQRQSTSVSTPRRNSSEPDEDQVTLARRVLAFDDAWRNNQLPTHLIFDALMELVFPQNSPPRPLTLPFEVKNDERVAVDSVIDRLAKRAHWSKRTDKLLKELSKRSVPATPAMTALALLRDERGDQAAEQLQSIKPDTLPAIPRELLIQTLVAALDDAACRKTAIELGQALVDQNRPTQRYAAVQPFDTLSLQMAQVALENQLDSELVSTSIKDYLTLKAHDNDRYSGNSSRLSRRLSQLDKVGQMLLTHGKTDRALGFLAMRQSIFSQGMDTGRDWTGLWAMENLQAMSDREAAYKKLVEWTFQGDGPLNVIQVLARRQPLPDWIPESVRGPEPNFPPLADSSLPIATNHYFLAKLAAQSGMESDLIERYAAAVEQQRAGALVGEAIVRAALGQPLEPRTLEAITKHLDSIRPQDGEPKSPAPLGELQLASILVESPDNEAFCKHVAEEAVKHAHRQSRGHLMPWIARYQHHHGWNESSTLADASSLSHWIQATHASAKDFHEGKTPPLWVTDGTNKIRHVCGFGNDYLWLKYPLQGNFTIEMETLDGDWREAGMVYDAIRFIALGNSGRVSLKSEGSIEPFNFYTSALKKNDWNRCRIELDEEHFSYLVNDTLVYREERTESSPWFAIFAMGDRRTPIRNVKITGQPKIPRNVELIPDDTLRGWSRRYYSGRNFLPLAKINTDKHEDGVREPYRYGSGAAPADQLDKLVWSVRDGELISGNMDSFGHQQTTCIQYERPLGDGETWKYEFFYEPGKFETYPTLGRSAYMLRPEGCKLRWMKAMGSTWQVPLDFEADLQNAAPENASFKEGEWNEVAITRSGDEIQISLNETLVAKHRPYSPLGQMVFGFYRPSEDVKVRVRNATLTGPWPRSLPENLFEIESNQ